MFVKFFAFLLIGLPIGASQFKDKEWLRDHTYMPYLSTHTIARMKSKDEGFRTIRHAPVHSHGSPITKKEQKPLVVSESTQCLAEAFGNLANNKQQSEKEKEDFKQRLQRDLPRDISRHVATFKDVGQACSIDNMTDGQKISLFSCVIKKQPHLPSPVRLLKDANKMLRRLFADNWAHLPLEQHRYGYPYIIAVCGVWSFKDEPSRMRYQISDAGGFNDLDLYFAREYPGAKVQPLKSDEFVGILYSDGKVAWKVSKASLIFLKSIYQDQWKFCSQLNSKLNDCFSQDELSRYKALPLFMQKCIKQNFNIADNLAGRMVKDGVKHGKKITPFLLGVGVWFDYKIGSLWVASNVINVAKYYNLYNEADRPFGRDEHDTYFEKKAKKIGFSIGTSIQGFLAGGLLKAVFWATEGVKLGKKAYEIPSENV